MNLDRKKSELEALISDAGSAVVAFSGGVDSSLLTYFTHRILGDRMLAVTARSSTYPAFQLLEAYEFVSAYGIPHLVIDSEELDIPNFCANTPDRCYHCKSELFGQLCHIAEDKELRWVFDGTNLDDHSDYRPGMKAAKELGVRSPLAEAGLTKEDIRKLSKKENLPTWDRPAFACLASRIPYGSDINAEKLRQVELAEKAVGELGFKQYRVRHHDNLARIEIAPEELPRAMTAEVFSAMSKQLKEAGFTYVTLDVDGYRTGSMNETLGLDEKTK